MVATSSRKKKSEAYHMSVADGTVSFTALGNRWCGARPHIDEGWSAHHDTTIQLAVGPG